MSKSPSIITGSIADYLEGVAVGIAPVVDSLTNSCMQAIATEMKKNGLRGGLRDSRQFREQLRSLVAQNVGATITHRIHPQADIPEEARE
jgi:hypothetical protein